MNGEFIGLIAVIMSLGIPMAAMYTYFRVRKLRTEERLAAMQRGVSGDKAEVIRALGYVLDSDCEPN